MNVRNSFDITVWIQKKKISLEISVPTIPSAFSHEPWLRRIIINNQHPYVALQADEHIAIYNRILNLHTIFFSHFRLG